MIRETDLHPGKVATPSKLQGVMDAAVLAIENAPSVLVARVKCGKCGKSAGELIARGKAITLDSATAQDLRWGSPPACTCSLISCPPWKLGIALRKAQRQGKAVTFRLGRQHVTELAADEKAMLDHREDRDRWREQTRGRSRQKGNDLTEGDLDVIEALRDRGEHDPYQAFRRASARDAMEALRRWRGSRTP